MAHVIDHQHNSPVTFVHVQWISMDYIVKMTIDHVNWIHVETLVNRFSFVFRLYSNKSRPYSGTCETLVNNTYLCHCSNGWRGLRCETRIDLCQEIQCLNDGVCRSTFLNFTCECLGENYSGRLCEKVNSRTKLLQTVSTSFSYVSIVILTSFAILIITMDILKYVFKIDPVSKAKGKAEAKKKLVQKEKFVWAIKYKYIP